MKQCTNELITVLMKSRTEWCVCKSSNIFHFRNVKAALINIFLLTIDKIEKCRFRVINPQRIITQLCISPYFYKALNVFQLIVLVCTFVSVSPIMNLSSSSRLKFFTKKTLIIIYTVHYLSGTKWHEKLATSLEKIMKPY